MQFSTRSHFGRVFSRKPCLSFIILHLDLELIQVPISHAGWICSKPRHYVAHMTRLHISLYLTSYHSVTDKSIANYAQGIAPSQNGLPSLGCERDFVDFVWLADSVTTPDHWWHSCTAGDIWARADIKISWIQFTDSVSFFWKFVVSCLLRWQHSLIPQSGHTTGQL